MATVAVVGLQWGDEGKGKITDFLAQQAEVVVRCQGGNNAGHTVHTEQGRYHLHLLPAGILHAETLCLLGNGVVLDPAALLEEMEAMEKVLGRKLRNFRISRRAHLIFPTHRWIDEEEESLRLQDRIGTTGRGVGPAYGDKVARVGLRAADLADADGFIDKLTKCWEQHAQRGARFSSTAPALSGEAREKYRKIALKLQPFLADTSDLLHQALERDATVLFEGAQGTMLDLDHGTYPFVTSSHPSIGGICTGAGVGPKHINRVLGVMKAYTTRVGDGPFPTELQDAAAERIREVGQEYGTTTGRARRVGWLDAVAARYACRLNGVTDLAIHCLDVLSGLPEVKICTAYERDGKRLTSYPATCEELAGCKPVYETWPGWEDAPLRGDSLEQLPAAAQNYLKRLVELLGAPLSSVSVGSQREATIVLRPLFGR